MVSHRIVFNHVGLCVADTTRSRRFYEGLLGFEFWWELEPPDEGTDQLLQLNKPIGLHATYLVRDGLVLELLAYSHRSSPGRAESCHGPNGAHPSVAIGLGSGERLGDGGQLRGIGGRRHRLRSVGDDPRPGRAVAGAALGFLARGPATTPSGMSATTVGM